MPPKRRRRFQGLYYHSSPPKVLSMNGQTANSNGRRTTRGPDVKLSTIRIWMHEKDIGKLTRVLWAGQGNRLRQQASTNAKVKRFLAAVPYVMNSIRDVHQAVIDNNLENLQSNLEPPVPPALVTCRDANGLNLIHKAAGLGHATILEYLLTTWPDGALETDVTGKTPLHWAASAKNNMRCYTLLTQAGCDEEAVDYKMKTPSFYRHKPHEIERAFLTYVPEAPRVSPDVATDWEALSDESGDGKKLDIKIPEMNGFGRQSNAESNENTSEAEMIEAASGHEDEDAAAENNEPTTEDGQTDDVEVVEDEPDNNEAEENSKEQPADEDKTEEEEEEEKDEEEEEDEEEQSKDENHEHDDSEDAKNEHEIPNEEETQDEKQQTQTVDKTTANLTKDLKDTNENENKGSKEQENEHEKDDHDFGENEAEDTNKEEEHEGKNAHFVHISEDSREKQSDKDKEEEIYTIEEDKIFEKGEETLTGEISKEPTIDEKNGGTVKATKNEIEKDEKLNDFLVEGQDENVANGRKKTDEENKPRSPLKTVEENANGGIENESDNKGDLKIMEPTAADKNDEENAGTENDENQSDSKTLGETLAVIKDEVKDNVKYLANQIKNVFSDKEDGQEENEKKHEIPINEDSDSGAEAKEELNDESASTENKIKLDKQVEKETEINNKDKQECTKDPLENKENERPTDTNAEDIKDQDNPPEQYTDHQDLETDDKEMKQENEESKKDLQGQTHDGSSPDDQKESSSNAIKTVDSKTATTTSSPSFNTSNENTPSSAETPLPTAPKTPTKESPKKTPDKTEEDENNNHSDLANKIDANATAADTTKQTEAITDEHFKEIDNFLEEYKKDEENSLPEKETDITAKLEEIADNIKENVKEMVGKVTNVFSTASLTKDETRGEQDEATDVVVRSASPQQKISRKKSFKDGHSSDDTGDEDEESQADAKNEDISNKADDEVVIENDEMKPAQEHDLPPSPSPPPPPPLDPTSEKNVEERHDQDDNEDKVEDGEQNGEVSPTSSLAIEGFVQGDAEDNTVQSQTAAFVDEDDEETRLQNIIASGDMEQLAQIVLNGDGQKLLNVEAAEPEIQAFLRNVPNYMQKIRRVHEAARNGSLLNLQQALDRRKFAVAKDEISPNGATPLHVAVIFGNSDIVRYLSARFPETTTITDNDGRTALHYAAVVNDNGHFYNILLQLGANPKIVDKVGHTPEDYLGREELMNTLNYGQLLKRFGAEDLEEKLLSDQGRIENQSIQENPLFKTEQGKYLADNLADPLIKALTQVAQKRPNDPLQFLANYLQSYVATRNTNGRITTQAAVHSGSSATNSTRVASSKQPTPPPPATEMQQQIARMNGYVKHETADNIEDDAGRQIEEIVGNDADDSDNDSDAAMSKKMEERDEHGQSMLHFACARSHRKGGLINLIEEAKVDITYRDELYRTARDVALQANQVGNAKEIDRYVMSLAIVGDIKPFEHFAVSGYDHIIDVLDDNETPIIQVVEARGLNELADYLKTIRPLEELREELHQMLRDNNVVRVKEIADGPSGKWLIKAKNYYGRTALHIAILRESIEIVEHFVNRCPEALKIGDNLERTPLHYAMGTNIIESISRVLIQNGAKRTYKDLKGRQPSYYFMNKADILRLQEEEDESR